MKTAINNYQEDQYRENGWDHLDFGDTKRVTTGLGKRLLTFSCKEIDCLVKHRDEMNKLWPGSESYTLYPVDIRNKMFEDSEGCVRYISEWREMVQKTGFNEFELLIEEEINI